MGWGDLWTVINKVLPSREERIRGKISELERERDEIIGLGIPSNERVRFDRVLSELRKLEEALKNR